MFRSTLGARTVSVETALACLDRVSEARGDLTTQDATEDTISLDQLIAVARKRGVKLLPRALDWSRLVRATATAPVLLRLNNGNMIVALSNQEPNPTQIVVSDPLYQDGKVFLLPEDALIKAWAGEALRVEREQAKAERAVRLVLLALSVAGLVAGVFLLIRALLNAIGT